VSSRCRQEGLAGHILLLLEEDTLWQRFSAAGQSRVRTLFDLQKQSRVLEEIYEQVLLRVLEKRKLSKVVS